ncbi:homoserine dehydrogenase [Rubrimonas cliftonensis]|uniref:Homoserine dehydrogenase n=1 Tax=Rubrimonas cliftonensis TaxID=89524 RepID=A0A1H3VYA6_9RHOB|nr:homoserine dehydrogenase [Rubrimonas cliftonensis]SDZ79789.1 homoserine dehydrogenase [Rubrimonas cliftonensis]
MTQPLRVGLAGLGTVGAGVARLLRDNADLIAPRAGRPIAVGAVSARNRGRDRGVDLSAAAWEDDPVALAGRGDLDVVVEAMGGSDGPALATVQAALSAGRHVVTANKALLAWHGAALAAAAEAAGVALRFEAAVAGGVPIVKGLSEGLAANRIARVYGVLNGTCNYILTEMARSGRDYAPVLAEAQAKGYAEADPSFDVGGIDAAHKLALLASLAFGVKPDFGSVSVEGIDAVSLADIAHADALGYRVKLLGVARRDGDAVERAVRPCLVRAGSAIGQLDGVTNAVVVEGDFVGRCVFEGPGAGAGPTASAIVADLIDIARGAAGPAFGVPAASLAPPVSGALRPAEHYVRLSLDDRPGALAEIAADLGTEGVSIRAMNQPDHAGEGGATVLIVTHACQREALDRALARVAARPVSLAEPVAFRIEDV